MQGALGLTKAVIDPIRHPMRLPVGAEALFEGAHVCVSGLRRREEAVCRPAGEPLTRLVPLSVISGHLGVFSLVRAVRVGVLTH